jgi:hypothetical protein
VASIIAIGFEAGGFLPSHPEPPSFPGGLDRQDLEELVEIVADALVRHGHALAIYPTWNAEPSLRRLQTVRSALSTTRLATYASPLPPLAGAVLASVTAAVAPLVPSVATLLAGLPLLEAQLLVVAWLGRVTGLREPAPTLLQHAVSVLPNTAFGVSSWPKPSVRRLSRKDRRVPLPRVRGPLRLAVAARDGDLGWVRNVVAPALGDPPLHEVPATAGGPRWWGSRRLVEVVAYPTGLSELVALLEEQATRLCSWCGEETAADPVTGVCVFCHRRLDKPAVAEQAA